MPCPISSLSKISDGLVVFICILVSFSLLIDEVIIEIDCVEIDDGINVALFKLIDNEDDEIELDNIGLTKFDVLLMLDSGV